MGKGCVEGPTTAVVLAGGRGSRLASVVPDRPKVLAQVGGQPFLGHVLARLLAAGVEEVVLCTGHLAPQIEAAFGTEFGGLRLVYSTETGPLGTAGALRLAAPLLAADPVLVLNGDSLCGVDLRAFWSWHHASGARVSLVTVQVADGRAGGRVEADGAGRVVRFVEKSPQRGPARVNAGIYAVPLELLHELPAGRPLSLERDLLPAWVGCGLHAYASNGTLLDIGTPASYAAAIALAGQGGLRACAS